jgi:hypothetical protein
MNSKSIVIASLFLALSLAAQLCQVPVYMMSHKPNTVDGNASVPVYPLQSYIELLENNAGLLLETPLDSQMINEYKTGDNLWRPLALTYIFSIHTNSPAANGKKLTDRSVPSFNIVVDNEETLLSNVFSQENPASLAHRAKEAHETNDTFHLFSDETSVLEKFHGVSVFPLRVNGEVSSMPAFNNSFVGPTLCCRN